MARRGIVDTSVVVSYLRNFEPVAEKFENLLENDHVMFSVITVFELELGLQDHNDTSLDWLFEMVTILDFDHPIARLSAEFYHKLEKDGDRIGYPDTFIAATASREGLPLYTQNAEHFERIESVDVIELP